MKLIGTFFFGAILMCAILMAVKAESDPEDIFARRSPPPDEIPGFRDQQVIATEHRPAFISRAKNWILKEPFLRRWSQFTCKTGWEQYKDKCYYFDGKAKRGIDAQRWCKQNGAVLFNERDSVDFMIKTINRKSKLVSNHSSMWYLGFIFKEETFYFSNGSKVNKLWQDGYPKDASSNQCILISDRRFKGVVNKWWNVPCDGHDDLGDDRGFVCQKKAATKYGGNRGQTIRQRGWSEFWEKVKTYGQKIISAGRHVCKYAGKIHKYLVDHGEIVD